MIPNLEHRLGTLGFSGETTSYGALARVLGLTGPRSIARITQELESLMEQDAANGDPLRAALVVGRHNNNLPNPGFFAKAAALGFDVSDPAGFVAAERARLAFISIQNTLDPANE